MRRDTTRRPASVLCAAALVACIVGVVGVVGVVGGCKKRDAAPAPPGAASARSAGATADPATGSASAPARAAASVRPPRVRVELKLLVGAGQTKAALRAMKLDGTGAQRRTSYFFDDKARALRAAGIVLRARARGDDADDSTVKLRLANLAGVGSWVVGKGDFKCENDRSVAPGAGSGSLACQLTVEQPRGAIAAVASGKRPIKTLLSSSQLRLLRKRARVDPWKLALRAIGPVTVWRYKRRPALLGGKKVTIEHWRLDNGRDLIELSLKTGRRKAPRRAELLRRWARSFGVTSIAKRASKTAIVFDAYR